MLAAAAAGLPRCALAQETIAPPSPYHSNPARATAPLGRGTQPGTDRNSLDLSQIKSARLESESGFFDRLEKQKKIDDTKTAVDEALRRLDAMRRELNPVGIHELDAARADLPFNIERALEQFAATADAADHKLNMARTLLRRYLERQTAETARPEATAVVTEVRRLLKGMERDTKTLSGVFTSTTGGLDAARAALEQSLRSIRPGDARLPKLAEQQADLNNMAAAIQDASTQLARANELVQQARTQYFPDCSTAGGPCQGTARALADQSGPALSLLDEAARKLDEMFESVDSFRQARLRATADAEEADALAHPELAQVRSLESRAAALLRQASEQLDAARRLLSGDCPGTVLLCAHCGKPFARTRKIMDPEAACVATQEMIDHAQEIMAEAQRVSAQIVEPLTRAREAAAQPGTESALAAAIDQALSELRSARGIEGATELITLALSRAKEFKEQSFEFYPNEPFPPAVEDMPPRVFPPMVATYAARVTWHYPAYFEDRKLERYGQHFGVFQPVVSYGKFLADLALVPYNMYLDPPYEIEYTLGLYRPGDCVPKLLYVPEPNLGAAAFEAAVIYGFLQLP